MENNNQHWWRSYFKQCFINEFFNNNSIKINIEFYIRESMKDYAETLEANLTQLGYYSSEMNLENFYVTDAQISNLNNIGTITNIFDLVSIENKIRYQWWGFTYFFMDKLLGVDAEAHYQVGYSTVPYPKRFNWYLKTLIEDPTKRTFYRTGEKQIYGWIYDYLDKEFGI